MDNAMNYLDDFISTARQTLDSWPLNLSAIDAEHTELMKVDR